MNAPARTPATAAEVYIGEPLNLLNVLQARAEAKAILVALGDYDFIESVDELQGWAVDHGLVVKFGQDEVQRVLAAAFAIVGYTDE